MKLRWFCHTLFIFLFLMLIIPVTAAEKPERLVPQKIELKSTPLKDGWVEWTIDREIPDFPERINVLAVQGDTLWVGTSFGRLLTRSSEEWIVQAQIQEVQITGIAVESPDKLWLSTSDGIRRLDRQPDQSWEVATYRQYFQGHPSFVSGSYIPGEDSRRLWGYVDDIYFPRQEKAYAPFVISKEHGLFSWSAGVWHHFLPHYGGANSEWLDLTELIPHRRPTCMLEDHQGHLWVGTAGDGLVRFNANGRKYHRRKPENNQPDGTEFSQFGFADFGCNCDRVVDLAVSEQTGVWALLASFKSGSHLAHYDGLTWSTLPLGEKTVPSCLLEIEPGVLLVGDLNYNRDQIKKVTWRTRQIEPMTGPKHGIRNLVKLADGRVFAASWWGLYEQVKQAKSE